MGIDGRQRLWQVSGWGGGKIGHAKTSMRVLLRRHGFPRVIVTDRLRIYVADNARLGLNVEHHHHQGLKTGGECTPAAPGAREDHVAGQIGAPVAAARFDP